MPPATLGTLSQAELARRLESDIRRRNLPAGTRYLSTRQVAEEFDVSAAAASLAMQALVERGVLERRERSGTYIASRAEAPAAAPIETIFVINPLARAQFSALPVDLLLDSIQRSHPGVSVQFAFLSVEGKDPTREFLDRLLLSSLAAGSLVGVIACSCPREVYAYLDELGVPLVVLGSLDADQRQIPSIDTDHYESGRLLAEYLIRRGHRRLAVFSVGAGRPGDFQFHDGIVQAVTDAGLPPNALVTRLLPSDLDLFRGHAESVLSLPDHPTGVICRGDRMLETIAEVAESLGLRVERGDGGPAAPDGVTPSTVELVFDAFITRRSATRHPHAQTVAALEQIGDRIGLIFQQQRDGERVKKPTIVLPVELYESGDTPSTSASPKQPRPAERAPAVPVATDPSRSPRKG